MSLPRAVPGPQYLKEKFIDQRIKNFLYESLSHGQLLKLQGQFSDEFLKSEIRECYLAEIELYGAADGLERPLASA